MVNYNDILKVVEDYVEKCKATARAKNIGKSNQKEKIGTTEEKATYKDKTEITVEKSNPKKVKYKESETEKLERRKTALQSTTATLEEKFKTYLNETMTDLGIEGDLYFSDDGLEVGLSYRRPEYDEDGNEVDSYSLYHSDTIPLSDLNDEDKEFILDEIESHFKGSKNYRTYEEYETEDFGFSYKGDKDAYYKVKEEYWEEGRFYRSPKYPERVNFHIVTNSRKRRTKL